MQSDGLLHRLRDIELRLWHGGAVGMAPESQSMRVKFLRTVFGLVLLRRLTYAALFPGLLVEIKKVLLAAAAHAADGLHALFVRHEAAVSAATAIFAAILRAPGIFDARSRGLWEG
jgi:hypothetical protein